jgi:hypothetical protein
VHARGTSVMAAMRPLRRILLREFAGIGLPVDTLTILSESIKNRDADCCGAAHSESSAFIFDERAASMKVSLSATGQAIHERLSASRGEAYELHRRL